MFQNGRVKEEGEKREKEMIGVVSGCQGPGASGKQTYTKSRTKKKKYLKKI